MYIDRGLSQSTQGREFFINSYTNFGGLAKNPFEQCVLAMGCDQSFLQKAESGQLAAVAGNNFHIQIEPFQFWLLEGSEKLG